MKSKSTTALLRVDKETMNWVNGNIQQLKEVGATDDRIKHFRQRKKEILGSGGDILKLMGLCSDMSREIVLLIPQGQKKVENK